MPVSVQLKIHPFRGQFADFLRIHKLQYPFFQKSVVIYAEERRQLPGQIIFSSPVELLFIGL